MNKYIVIGCYEREIYKIGGPVDSLYEAQKIMGADFVEYLSHYVDEDEMERIEDGVDRNCYVLSDDFEFNDTDAWYGRDDNKMDWKIIEIDISDANPVALGRTTVGG